ncbi:hypothetical protein [Uliginosibacterium aquaticum]|uniref:CPBP family intramembrane metalloprotease n=1 Tax=Uliginosibacterium aquaticum TaxID=2731212 RepID=A0ABX2IS11_9RHOO|nr:hypothetical protein [Uliginosibacterium aquaticum]NSL57008.1 hypothetical protein [Uliginosibacterium aquaticum]
MTQHLRRFAIALWLISFVVPTGTLQNGTVALGAQIALAGLFGMAFMFPVGLLGMPLQAISLLSNLLMLDEIRREASRSSYPNTLFRTLLLVSTAALNVAVAQQVRSFLPDLLSHPGFYLWSSSFVLLASIAAFEERLFFFALLKRSLALSAVALVVFFTGLVAIFLGH